MIMKTILFIDESESHRFLLQEELSEAGYEILTANEIEEALSKWRDSNPDLIILELRQKNLKNETFRALKNQYSSIPWIGYSTFVQCPEEYKEWINFYVQKSSELNGLRSLIGNL
jgi:DNA-binding NtrC family response regulator